MTFKTVISAYSLKKGEIGKAIGQEVMAEFSTGKAALLALEFSMDTIRRVPETGHRFLIEMPDKRRMPFDAAYTEIFGESPIRRDNKESLYPRLRKGGAK